jgi:hypothetical protein
MNFFFSFFLKYTHLGLEFVADNCACSNVVAPRRVAIAATNQMSLSTTAGFG